METFHRLCFWVWVTDKLCEAFLQIIRGMLVRPLWPYFDAFLAWSIREAFIPTATSTLQRGDKGIITRKTAKLLSYSIYLAYSRFDGDRNATRYLDSSQYVSLVLSSTSRSFPGIMNATRTRELPQEFNAYPCMSSQFLLPCFFEWTLHMSRYTRPFCFFRTALRS